MTKYSVCNILDILAYKWNSVRTSAFYSGLLFSMLTMTFKYSNYLKAIPQMTESQLSNVANILNAAKCVCL